MRAVVTRVKEASVVIEGNVTGKIEHGFLILLGIGPEDTEAIADKMAEKICNCRVFEDENGKMNLSLDQVRTVEPEVLQWNTANSAPICRYIP